MNALLNFIELLSLSFLLLRNKKLALSLYLYPRKRHSFIFQQSLSNHAPRVASLFRMRVSWRPGYLHVFFFRIDFYKNRLVFFPQGFYTISIQTARITKIKAATYIAQFGVLSTPKYLTTLDLSRGFVLHFHTCSAQNVVLVICIKIYSILHFFCCIQIFLISILKQKELSLYDCFLR